MCSIWGFVSDPDFKNREAIIRLLCCLGSQRGTQSTGIALIENGESRIIKDAIHPFTFAQTTINNGETNKATTIIGHTRLATHGSVNQENSHPFHIGNTVGAHNGVVNNIYSLKQKLEPKFEVDSQYLIYLLDKQNNLGDAYGTMNVSYWKKDDKFDLRLIRCNYPLAVAYLEEQKAFIYTSLEEHLDIVLNTFNLQYQKLNIEDYHRFDVRKENGKVQAWTTDISKELDSFNKSYTNNNYYSSHNHRKYPVTVVHGSNCGYSGSNQLPYHYMADEEKAVIDDKMWDPFPKMDDYDIDELINLEEDESVIVTAKHIRAGTPLLLG